MVLPLAVKRLVIGQFIKIALPPDTDAGLIRPAQFHERIPPAMPLLKTLFFSSLFHGLRLFR